MNIQNRHSGRSTQQLREALDFAITHDTIVSYAIHPMNSRRYYESIIVDNFGSSDFLKYIRFISVDLLDDYALYFKRLRGHEPGSLFIDHHAIEVVLDSKKISRSSINQFLYNYK